MAHVLWAWASALLPSCNLQWPLTHPLLQSTLWVSSSRVSVALIQSETNRYVLTNQNKPGSLTRHAHMNQTSAHLQSDVCLIDGTRQKLALAETARACAHTCVAAISKHNHRQAHSCAHVGTERTSSHLVRRHSSPRCLANKSKGLD